MRDSCTHQPLTYDVRLPDEAQADALRLLHVSRAVVNQALEILWPHLDKFSSDRAGPARICYYPGWLGSAFLQSSQRKAVFLRLCR
jgi:hypothetical protein